MNSSAAKSSKLSRLLGLTIILASCSSQGSLPPDIQAGSDLLTANVERVPVTDANREVAMKLKSALLKMQKSLPEDARASAQFIDFDNQLAYDAKYGLIKIEVGHLNSVGNKVLFANGSTLPVQVSDTDRPMLSTLATRCSPYYQVKTNVGYSGIYSTITPGIVSGIVAGEAVYDYLALYTANGPVFEGGVLSSAGTAYAPSYWYGYVRGPGVSNGYLILRDYNPEGFSDGRFAPQQAFNMQIWVPYDGVVNFNISLVRNGINKSYGYYASGANIAGNNQTFSKTTSLLINGGPNDTGSNGWSNGYLSPSTNGLPDNRQYLLWTGDRTAPGYPNFVSNNINESPACGGSATINRTNYAASYNETININQYVP